MKKTLIVLVALFMVTAFSASAATFKYGEVYEYKSDVVSDDIYIAGGSVDVSSDINGDGIIAGGEVSVLGDISQDLNIAGGSVSLLGSVGDDVRAAGGNISVSSDIAGDFIAAGGFVKILSDSTIAGDVVIAGGAVIMNGEIEGDLTVYGEDVKINGLVNGNVTLKFTKKVTIGEDALIVGNLTYTATEDIEILSGAVGGTITRVESVINKFSFDKKNLGKFIGLFFFIKLMLMIVAGVLAVVIFKRFSKNVAEDAHNNFWKHALVGFITLVIVPIAATILFATIVGSFVGVILLGAYMLTLMIAKVYAGIVAGALLSKWIKKEVIVDWKWAVFGIVALQVVMFIPVVGWLAGFFIMLATFGTLGTLAYQKFWLER